MQAGRLKNELPNFSLHRAERTNSTNDLALHAQLVLEAAGDPADLSVPSSLGIRRVFDFVPHVPRVKSKNEEQADAAPEYPRLNDGQDVRVGSGDERGGDG